jgi:hypothetical protein
VNTYEIYVNNKRCYFVINGTLVHTVTATTARYSNTLNFPVRFENTNTGIGTVETLEAWTGTISRMGKSKTEVIYKYIAGAATTVCKLTQGKILKVIVSGTAANVITIVDNNTGTTPVMAVINAQNNVPQYVDFGADGCPFFTGLSIVTSSAAGVTVIYE